MRRREKRQLLVSVEVDSEDGPGEFYMVSSGQGVGARELLRGSNAIVALEGILAVAREWLDRMEGVTP